MEERKLCRLLRKKDVPFKMGFGGNGNRALTDADVGSVLPKEEEPWLGGLVPLGPRGRADSDALSLPIRHSIPLTRLGSTAACHKERMSSLCQWGILDLCHGDFAPEIN